MLLALFNIQIQIFIDGFSEAFMVGFSKALSWFKSALPESRASDTCEVTILKLFCFRIYLICLAKNPNEQNLKCLEQTFQKI